jgi:hypothetical protein
MITKTRPFLENPLLRSFILLPFLGAFLAACASIDATHPRDSCPVSKPVWVKPPEDGAVPDPPSYGYYFVNDDLSILASAWWAGVDDHQLRASGEGEGFKIGWFRPEGATLEITGQHMDDPQAPPLQAHIPCCYPTRFQASGLSFPTEGCWEVTAKAADSELTFIVWVEP